MDALIFDFDGVIVDSEPVHHQGFVELLAPFGVELTAERYIERYLGLDDEKVLSMMAADFGLEFSDEQFQQILVDKTDHLKRWLAESVVPMPGVIELMTEAHAAGVPMAICSGSMHDEVHLGIKSLEIGKWLMSVITSDEVTKRKPDPEGYLATAANLTKILGRPIRPECCAVCEDSPTGISAATSAGMNVCGVASTYGPDDLAAAKMVVKDLSEVSLATLQGLVAEG